MVSATELPALMNRRNDLPKLGAVGPRRIDTRRAYGVEPNTDEQNAAFRRVEHERIEKLPDDEYRKELYRFFGVGKSGYDFDVQHAAVDSAFNLAKSDGRPRDTDTILADAAKEYAASKQETAQFYKDRITEMDAKQEALEPKRKPNRATFAAPVTVPPPAPVAQTDAARDAETDAFFAAEPPPVKSLQDEWREKMLKAYGKHKAAIEFSRATARKTWAAANADGLDDAVIVKMLEDHMAANPATEDVPEDKPATSPAQPAPATPQPEKQEAPRAPALTTAKQANPRPTTKGPKVPEYHPLASADEVRAKYTIRVQGNREYLQVAGRILLFRMDHKAGRIETEMVASTPDYFVFKASVFGTDGVLLATGHAMATVAGSAKFSGRTLEKAETSAIGRALAHAGYGTDQAGEDVDEDEMLSDTPVAA